MSSLAERVLIVAASQIGVRETSRNRGPHVDQYVRRVKLDPAGRHSWCIAFLFWSFDEAAHDLAVDNPMPRTGSTHKLWKFARANGLVITRPRPGAIGCIDKGEGKGHGFLVEKVESEHIVTIEGNTDGSGRRDGDGVYRRWRKPEEASLGYLFFHTPGGADGT